MPASSRVPGCGLICALALLAAEPALAEPTADTSAPPAPVTEPPVAAPSAAESPGSPASGADGATPSARAASSPAHQLFLEAEQRYDAGDFAGALLLLRQSYDLATPELRIGLLFSLAQAYRQLDHCEQARDHYAEYLSSSRAKAPVVAQRRDDARYYWQKLNAECPVSAGAPDAKPSGAAAPAPAATSASSAQAVAPPKGSDHSPLGTNQVVAWSLFGVSGVALAGSVIFGLASHRAEADVERRAKNGVSYDDVVRPREEDGRLYEKYTYIFAGGAVFCAGVGAALLLLEGDDARPPALGLNVDPRGGSLRLNYKGTF
jgi:hypothetical protein